MKFPTLLGSAGAAESTGAKPDFDIGDMRWKLEAAEAKIRCLTDAAVPEVRLRLPRLHLPEAPRPVTEISRDAPAELEAGVPSQVVEEERMLLEAEVGSRAIAATASQLRTPLLTAALSFSLAVVSASVGLAPILPALATAVASATTSAFILKGRVVALREVVLAHLDSVRKEVLEALQQATEVVARLAGQLTDAIDRMIQEQRPVLEKVRELESTLQVDIPDPGDLKRPLDDSEGQVEGHLGAIVEECRGRVDQLCASVPLLRAITDGTPLLLFAVAFPTVLTLLCNVGLAVLETSSKVSVSAHDQALFTGQKVGNSTFYYPEGIAWADYLRPWFSQMLAMALQVAIGVLATQEARAYSFVNSFICGMEESLNAELNAKLAATVRACFEDAFKQVEQRCDAFFPQFKDLLEKVDQADQLAQKAGNMAALASAFKW
jgi:hypothetical protein